MLLTLFILLGIIALFLIVWGELTKESVFNIVGWIFLFLLSIQVLLPGNLIYPSGNTEQVEYSYDGMGLIKYTISSNIITYDSFNDSDSVWFGRYLAIISIIGFILGLISVRRDFRSND